MICGYHTCNDEGEYDEIRENIPFLSGNDDGQWLTQGYYFWTDSEKNARHWGKQNQISGRCKGGYVIAKFTIKLKKGELFDLVGNSEHEDFLQGVSKRLAGILSRGNDTKNKSITVNQIISYLREQAKHNIEVFPYIAIKSWHTRDADNGKPIPYSYKNKVYYPLGNVRQLCVFDKGRESIFFEEFIHPKKYMELKK